MIAVGKDAPATREPKRRLRRILALAGVGLLVGLLGLELNLRMVGGPIEIFNPLRGFHDGDPRLGWKGKPGIARRFHTREFDVLVEHDEDGFRRPSPPRPQQSRENVLILGDSIAWGWGIGQGEGFTDSMQRALPDVAIYNRGVNAFSTGQEYLLLEDELAKREYDDVILLFSRTDFADNIDHKEHRPAFDLVGDELVPRNQPAPPALSNPIDEFIDEHSRAVHFLSWQLAWLKSLWRESRAPEEAPPDAVDASAIQGRELTARLLREMNALAHRHGARLTIAYAPTGITPEESELDAATRNLIESFCREEGIPFVDLGEDLREAVRDGKFVSFPRDAHWTREGHEIAAQTLLRSSLFASRRGGGKKSEDAEFAASGPTLK